MKKIQKALARLCVLACLALGLLQAQAQTITGFGDINIWAGDGATATNRAALVIQWNTGSGPSFTAHSFAWGYGWNSGTKTGTDMFNAVFAADSHLQATYAFSAIFGLYYDVNATGLGLITPGTAGLVDYSTNPATTVFADVPGTTGDPNALYQSGWATAGYWEYQIFGGNFSYPLYGGGTASYNVAGGSSYAAVSWTSSPIGASARVLENGSWDAYVFDPEFVYPTPAVVAPVAAVPEPSTLVLAILAAGILLYARKRLHAR